MCSWLHSQVVKPKKLLILSVNGVLCYFPQCVVLQGNVWVFNINIDLMKVEVKVGVEHFFPTIFENFYVAIWSCMKLEDVLEVLPMLMLEKFLDQFVFIWGHEQCSKISNIITLRSFYYLKDLKHVFYACHNLPYGKGDRMLLIDDEPNKALGNPNWSGLFLKSFKGKLLLKTKVQWLVLSSCLWPILIGLLMVKMVRVHHDIMQRYSKPCLSSILQNNYWFL